MPSNEKTCKTYSHTAYALTDLSGKANGNRVCELIRHKQKLYSALFNKGPTTSMYSCQNCTWSSGTTLLGILSFITALIFFLASQTCIHVLSDSFRHTWPEKIQPLFFFSTFVPLVAHIMGQTAYFVPTSYRYKFAAHFLVELCCDGIKVHLSQRSCFYRSTLC